MNIVSKINLIRGETKVWKFQRKDANGQVITTNPNEIYCTIKENYDASDYLIQKTFTNGDITYSDGWWYIVLSAADTLSLTQGRYVIDVKVSATSGETYHVIPQTLEVYPCVTEEI